MGFKQLDFHPPMRHRLFITVCENDRFELIFEIMLGDRRRGAERGRLHLGRVRGK